MKLSKAKLKPILALAALSAPGTLDARNLNFSKQNIYKLDTDNPEAEKQCTGKGGSVENGMCVMPEKPQPPVETKKKICLVYQPGHQGDDRYCSQSVPAPK